MAWTMEQMPDMTGKVVIVTGANSGLGYETSRMFAIKNATVVMACRNTAKGDGAALSKLRRAPLTAEPAPQISG